LTYVHFETLNGTGEGRYIRWVVHPDIFTVLQVASATRAYVRSHNEGLRDAYVELLNGGPLGDYFLSLVDSHRKAEALFVQAYGIPNVVPCRRCIRYWMRSETEKRTGMWPFFGCRSVPGYKLSCGNCVCSVEAASCEYHADNTRYKHLRASHDQPAPEEDLNRERSMIKFGFGYRQSESLCGHLIAPLTTPPDADN
jgi:hypothetical protein